jgi:hypothetical protein
MESVSQYECCNYSREWLIYLNLVTKRCFLLNPSARKKEHDLRIGNSCFHYASSLGCRFAESRSIELFVSLQSIFKD